MDDSILSGDLKLSAHVAVPNPPLPSLGLVLCHGLPNPPRGAATVGTTYPDLADHIPVDPHARPCHSLHQRPHPPMLARHRTETTSNQRVPHGRRLRPGS